MFFRRQITLQILFALRALLRQALLLGEAFFLRLTLLLRQSFLLCQALLLRLALLVSFLRDALLFGDTFLLGLFSRLLLIRLALCVRRLRGLFLLGLVLQLLLRLLRSLGPRRELLSARGGWRGDLGLRLRHRLRLHRHRRGGTRRKRASVNDACLNCKSTRHRRGRRVKLPPAIGDCSYQQGVQEQRLNNRNPTIGLALRHTIAPASNYVW